VEFVKKAVFTLFMTEVIGLGAWIRRCGTLEIPPKLNLLLWHWAKAPEEAENTVISAALVRNAARTTLRFPKTAFLAVRNNANMYAPLTKNASLKSSLG
jgi:hypothetical protein